MVGLQGDLSMWRSIIGVAAMCAAAWLPGVAFSDVPSQSSIAPPVERMLSGEEADAAAQLEEQRAAAAEAGRDEDAIRHAEALLELRTRLQGADHWQAIDARWDRDLLRKRAAMTPAQRDAFEAAEESRAAAQRALQADDSEAAETHWRADLAARVPLIGERHPEIGVALHELAVTLNRQSRFDEAHDCYAQSLSVFRETVGEIHPLTASAYNGLAFNHNSRGRFSDALPLYQRRLEIDIALYGEEHPETAKCYSNIAHTLKRQGRHAAAYDLFEKSLQIKRRTVGEHAQTTIIGYNNLAANLDDQGRNADAEPLYRRALELCRESLGEGHSDTAWTCSNLATNLTFQGRYEEALPFCERALKLCLQTHGELHQDTAWSYDILGVALHAQNRFSEAQPNFQKGLEIRQLLLGAANSDTATSILHLARNLTALGELEQAQLDHQRSLNLFRNLLGECHPHTAAAYSQLADCLFLAGKFDESAAVMDEGLRSYEAARLGVAHRGLDRAFVKSPYRLLALTRVKLGLPADAWQAAELALARGLQEELTSLSGPTISQDEADVRQRLNDELSSLQFRIRGAASQRTPDAAELAELHAARARAETELADLAVAIGKRDLADLASVQRAIPEDGALLMWIDVGAGPGGAQEHWGCVVRSTGDPVWERLPGTGPEGGWSDDDIQLPARLREALASRTTSLAKLNELASRLNAQRIDPLRRHLEGVARLYVPPVYEMAGVPIEVLTDDYIVSYIPSGTLLARLSQQAPPGSDALLALGDPVFRSSKTRPGPAVELPPGGLLIAGIVPGGQAEAAGIREGDVLLRYNGREVASLEALSYLAAASQDLPSIEVTIWRSEGDRVDEGDGSADAERKATELEFTLASGRLGIALSKEPAAEAIAQQREMDGLLAGLRSGTWSDLPGSRVEVVQIAALFSGRATALFDADASEASLEELRRAGGLRRFRYLHFATHGKANNHRAMQSVLILSQPGTADDPLSENAAPGLDGRLSASDVLETWDLDAELVTLSACESGLGRPGGGEGLLGFAQAFLARGSRAACLSLWKVSDRSAVLLMTRFYQNLLGARPGLSGPMPKAEALADAKRWLRELPIDEARAIFDEAAAGVDRRHRGELEAEIAEPDVDAGQAAVDAERPFAHPRHWAAFVLIGDPN
ncbi:MAG: CHAT domain-containing protein [Planctomyces sp.]|nr:CHAT domain-containing protein [Planctomyces sp.]